MSKTIQTLFLALVFISLALSGCGRTQGDDTSIEPVFPFQASITVGNSQNHPADPYLVTSETGQVFMSWTETNGDGRNRDVFVATVTSDGQQIADIRQMNKEPVASHGGENLAKFASSANDGLTGMWNAVSQLRAERPLEGQAGLTHMDNQHVLNTAYAASGEPFSSEMILNDDRLEISRANFTAMATAPNGKIFATWLDGRNDYEAKEVFLSVSDDGGRTFSKNSLISAWACPCCRPAIAFMNGGETVLVAHREYATPSGYIEPDNVRDHVMVRSTDGGQTFSEQVLISDDGWTAVGCPHAGISIAVDSKDLIHAVWWTGGRTPDESGIYYTYSDDGGQSFAPRQFLSEAPANVVLHTRVIVDKNDTVYALFEGVKENNSQILLAYRDADTGEWSPSYEVSDGTWNTFWPMLGTDDENLYVSWTERKGEESQVRLKTSPLVGN